ncbi:MAG TPA: cupin domain-containing protein, partial [Euzebya sp.]|nr:cupin domain-containing protein [Euzebya sp.]
MDTEPGAVSGWHRHGDHDTTIYVVSGRMRLQSGPAGEVVVEAGPGDLIHVPAHASTVVRRAGARRSGLQRLD